MPSRPMLLALLSLSSLSVVSITGQPTRPRTASAPAVYAAADSSGCASSSLARRLDFWVGDWRVNYPGTSHGGISTVSLELGKCLVVEHWTGGTGGEGENMMAFNREDGHWHGLYADNEGRVHVLTGTVTADSADFRGPSRGADGGVVLNRVRILRVSPDEVQQIWEKSHDGGTSWVREFMGVYSRRHP